MRMRGVRFDDGERLQARQSPRPDQRSRFSALHLVLVLINAQESGEGRQNVHAEVECTEYLQPCTRARCSGWSEAPRLMAQPIDQVTGLLASCPALYSRAAITCNMATCEDCRYDWHERTVMAKAAAIEQHQLHRLQFTHARCREPELAQAHTPLGALQLGDHSSCSAVVLGTV
jgi:hypothetical protein